MKPTLKLALLALLISAACTSCASKGTVALNPSRKVDKSVAIFTPGGFGRGCPINGFIVTARHVVQKRNNAGYYDVWWSDNFGHDGYGYTKGASEGVDGAVILPEKPNKPLQVKTGLPKVGEEVYWFDYDYKNSLATKVHRAQLVRRVGGHLILSEGATEGASGGCIFNSKGEAIGIIVWVVKSPQHNEIGIGLQFPEEWL